MEVNISGFTYIIKEIYEIQDKEKREEIIAEKLAGVIMMDIIEGQV